jgi:hypothetical protein
VKLSVWRYHHCIELKTWNRIEAYPDPQPCGYLTETRVNNINGIDSVSYVPVLVLRQTPGTLDL